MNIAEIKVLICDDSIMVRKKIADFLRAAGVAEIYEAKDGVQAVEMYKQHSPDLAFMDIVMPLKTGLEALVEITQFDPAARVVMASTVGTQGNLVAAIKAGAYEFLQKPLREEDILRLLDKILKV